MKLHELLLELKEILNRTEYGEWIDSNTGNVYLIEQFQGHEHWLETVFYPEILKKEPPSMLDNENSYMVALKYGLVRISHPVYYQLNIEGLTKAVNHYEHKAHSL